MINCLNKFSTALALMAWSVSGLTYVQIVLGCFWNSGIRTRNRYRVSIRVKIVSNEVAELKFNNKSSETENPTKQWLWTFRKTKNQKNKRKIYLYLSFMMIICFWSNNFSLFSLIFCNVIEFYWLWLKEWNAI